MSEEEKRNVEILNNIKKYMQNSKKRFQNPTEALWMREFMMSKITL